MKGRGRGRIKQVVGLGLGGKLNGRTTMGDSIAWNICMYARILLGQDRYSQLWPIKCCSSYNGNFVTWGVVRLTSAKYKPPALTHRSKLSYDRRLVCPGVRPRDQFFFLFHGNDLKKFACFSPYGRPLSNFQCSHSCQSLKDS
jgi:hypothetical protein